MWCLECTFAQALKKATCMHKHAVHYAIIITTSIWPCDTPCIWDLSTSLGSLPLSHRPRASLPLLYYVDSRFSCNHSCLCVHQNRGLMRCQFSCSTSTLTSFLHDTKGMRYGDLTSSMFAVFSTAVWLSGNVNGSQNARRDHDPGEVVLNRCIH